MKILNTIDDISLKIASLIPGWVALTILRISIFLIFWLAAQSKIDGLTVFGQHLAFWAVTDSAFTLFEYEYAVPLLPYDVAAYLAAFGEFFLSLGILFGLFTRFSAIGLIVMTGVIQIAYPNWQVHLLWLGILLVLVKEGAGPISLDKLLFKK